MTSTSPPVVPISNPQPTTTVSSAQSQPPVATPAFRTLITHISDNLRNGFSQRRPWAELADRSAFSKPESFSEVTLRIRKNYSYFRVNYLTIIAVVLAFSLITNPFSLLMLVGLLASWIFLYVSRPSDQPLVLFGRTLSDRDTLGVLIVLSVFVVFLTSVGSVLISALMVGAALVCAHCAFRTPEDLFLDDQEPSANTGFLSFIGGATTNAAGNAAPAVSARV